MKCETCLASSEPKSLAHEDWRCVHRRLHLDPGRKESEEKDLREVKGYEWDWYYIDEKLP